MFLFCSQSERGDGVPEHAGGKKKKPMPKQQKENLVFVSDFGEKISLFLPGFDVDPGERTAELVHDNSSQRSFVKSQLLSYIPKVSETDGDGDGLSGSGRSSRDGDDLSDGGSGSSPEIFETEERKETESPGASKRCSDVCKRSQASV